jgi:hypothetical protein
MVSIVAMLIERLTMKGGLARVRAVLVLLLVGGTIGHLFVFHEMPPGEFTVMTTGALASYFAGRLAERANGGGA